MLTLNQVVEKYWKYVCAIVYNRIKQDGDDIAANVFYKLSLVYTPTKFENDTALKGWLQLTAMRMCIDHARARTREAIHMQAYSEDVYNGQEPTTEADTSEKDRNEIEQYVINAILEQIKNLPPKTKQVFELHYFSKKTCKQIASILNISTQTAANQLQNARKILRMKVLFK